ATFFSWHPNGNVDKRTNLYYLESHDLGKTWRTIDRKSVQIPLTEVDNPALVHNYFSQTKNIYLKDINFDRNGNPIGLFLLSNNHKPGPDNGLRHWYVAHWQQDAWQIRKVTTSDHNYDMGSLYVDEHLWWVVAPTAPGPQPWSVGGEIEIWESNDQGQNWQRVLQVTSESRFSHSYLRRPENAHRDFYGFWADAYPDDLSISHLHFMNKAGKAFQLPYKIDGESYSFR
ncbi:MAG: BNR-4 repeat-containing protein, partial [Cyclobacteriaceae bacterium]